MTVGVQWNSVGLQTLQVEASSQQSMRTIFDSTHDAEIIIEMNCCYFSSLNLKQTCLRIFTYEYSHIHFWELMKSFDYGKERIIDGGYYEG